MFFYYKKPAYKKREAQVCQKLRDVNDTIVNGWKASGIYDAIRLGLDKFFFLFVRHKRVN